MEQADIEIDEANGILRIRTVNDLPFRIVQVVMLVFHLLVFIGFIAFIYYSITRDATTGGKILFVLYALFILWMVQRSARNILLYLKGEDELTIDSEEIHCHSQWGILHRKRTFPISRIQIFELHTAATGPEARPPGLLSPSGHGAIFLGTSRRRKIIFGQSMLPDELDEVFDKIEDHLSG